MKKEEMKKEEKVIEQPQTVELKDASNEQLEAFAFRIDQQIKVLQRQYNTVYQELASRTKE